jgi:hypothetical protein
MQRMKRTLLLFGLFCLLFSGAALAQASQPGIRVKQEKAQTIIYQIKVLGLGGPVSASQLDQTMQSKKKVVSAVTDPDTGICTVEVEKDFDVRYFRHLLEPHGLRMAKKFD